MSVRNLVVAAAVGALALPASSPAAAHTVTAGETLSGIAAANNLATSAVAAANGLAPDAQVITGTTLTIPGAPPAAGAPAAGSYRVAPGDALSTIAQRQGVSTAALAGLNGLSSDGVLLAGTTLRLPGAATAPAATAGAAPSPMGAYEVRRGDTLGGLAMRVGVPLAQMAFMNGLDPNRPLLAGTVLKLPTGASITSSAPAPATTVVPAAAPTAAGGRLSAAQIQAIAARDGVPASLVTAIAWQESGFNNAMVSSANARGIMQVMPGTWTWVQQNLTRSRLDPSSASDNVRAGALYLGQLLRQTGGDAATAIAGYYQGLASVRRIGMLPETRQYVANVLALRSRFGG